MLSEFGAVALIRFHDDMLGSPAWPAQPAATVSSEVWRWAEANHRFNSLIWEEEEQARRPDAAAADIATSKRLIDRHHQLRNDAIERIDEELLARLQGAPPAPDARLSSETAGAMIDRLSALALKVAHMRQQTRRDDTASAHVAACMVKLMRLEAQRHDLAICLDQLLDEAARGRAYFKIYRQFRMHNDSRSPYPYHYGAAGPQASAGSA